MPKEINSAITIAKCPECKRIFDLFVLEEADEWYYGHDCEVE